MSLFMSDGKEVELKPYGVIYNNDLMSGILLDAPDTYAFLSIHDTERQHIIEDIE